MRIADTDLTARKVYFDGTHRMCPPEDTIRRATPFLRAMGITRIADITGLDRIGLPVCVAIRPNSRSLSTSQGKGRTPAAARASAMMEAIEGWHGERVALPVRIDAWSTIAAEQPLSSPKAFGLRADAHLTPREPIPWVRAWDLMAGEWAWIPYETVSTAFVESPDRPPLFLKSTNGLASGNHLLEAVVHALYELVERDALTLGGLSGDAPRHVAPARIPNDYFRTLLGRLDDCGVTTLITDVTSDIGLPTFTCEMADDPRRGNWRALPAVTGHGTHADYTVALSRAVHEAIQSRATIISGSRDDLFPHDYRDALGRDAQLALAQKADAATGGLSVDPQPPRATFDEDLADILTRLKAVGIAQCYMVDLSRDEIGIPVVKVVVPGLEPPRTAQYQPGARASAVIGARAAA